MKLINSSFEIVEQDYSCTEKPQELLDKAYQHIEKCARTCYKSEDKITDESAKPFVERLINSGHTAMLEHATVYLSIHANCFDSSTYLAEFFKSNQYSIVNEEKTTTEEGVYLLTWHVSTNLRVIIENNILDSIKPYITAFNEMYHERRVCTKFILPIGIANEYVRHRVFSFAQESTRYCNYSKDKFGNELTFIKPCWEMSYDVQKSLMQHFDQVEEDYFELINHYNWKPQQAATVLPKALKTELMMTGFVKDWEHFFKLRCAENAHPQARELAIALKKEFENRKYI